jgi:pyruvate dehydrogenase kinase 2/3/4
MRGAGWASQGLALGWKRQMNLKLKHSREVTERKQVGDAESMINEGSSASGHHGLFKDQGGEV